MTAPCVERALGCSLHTTAGLWVPIAAVGRYYASEPLAVTLALCGTDGWVEWMLSRELLDRGLDESSGDMDAVAWPEGSLLNLRLTGDDATAWLHFPARAVQQFLIDTYTAIPVHLQDRALSVLIDTELQTLLETS